MFIVCSRKLHKNFIKKGLTRFARHEILETQKKSVSIAREATNKNIHKTFTNKVLTRKNKHAILETSSRESTANGNRLRVKEGRKMNLAYVIKNNGGITLNTNGTEFKSNKGYMVSLKDTEIIVSAGTIDEELKRYFWKLAEKAGDDQKIGYWLDNGRIYIDISVHVGDLDEAMRLAIENDQLAIFDLGNLETIRVK